MKSLQVMIERNGKMELVGSLSGNSSTNTRFRYDESFLQSADAVPISLSLPLQEESFSTELTKTFFDGLLPEGFTRRATAQMIHVDENDYLSILAHLGRECIGAIKIVGEDDPVPSGYEKLTIEQIKKLAEEGTTKSVEIVTKTHLSLTGASGKAGLYYNEAEKNWYLPLGDAPSTHIVKQSHIRLESIIANEQLCLMTAKRMGLDVPQSFIVNTGNHRDEDVLFATQRFDRKFQSRGRTVDQLPVPNRLHQEDFAQALGIPAAEKYENIKQGYLQRMFRILLENASDPITDQLKLWEYVIFDYLVGNTDNHIKNVSLLYSPDLTSLRLAPAYDILSTAVYESSTRDMAFFIGSESRLERISRDSFEEAAKEVGIGRRIAMQRLDRMFLCFEESLKESAAVLKQQGFPGIDDLRERIMELGGIANITKPV